MPRIEDLTVVVQPYELKIIVDKNAVDVLVRDYVFIFPPFEMYTLSPYREANFIDVLERLCQMMANLGLHFSYSLYQEDEKTKITNLQIEKFYGQTSKIGKEKISNIANKEGWLCDFNYFSPTKKDLIFVDNSNNDLDQIIQLKADHIRRVKFHYSNFFN